MVGQSDGDLLRIANTGETGPADVGIVREVMDQVLGLSQLVQVRGPPDTVLEDGGSSHYEGSLGGI